MIRVYAANVRAVAGELGQEALLAALPTSARERLARFARGDDRARSAVAALLVRFVVARSLGVDGDRIRFATNPYGKPHLRHARGFHFNAAHAGDWAVCATDSKPLGVDVEAVRPIDMDAAARALSRQERGGLRRLPPARRLRRFYELWTLKESYIKALGLGLGIPPDSFTIRILAGGEIVLTGPRAAPARHFWQGDIDQGYPVAVCATNDARAPSVVYVAPRALQEFARQVLRGRSSAPGVPSAPTVDG